MLLASIGKSNQPDFWSTVLAVYFGVLEGNQLQKTCYVLRDAYKNGTLSKRGNIRHILTSDHFNAATTWEISLAEKTVIKTGLIWERRSVGYIMSLQKWMCPQPVSL